MSEPTIICPSCKTEIKLTESLAAPLIESTKKQFEEKIRLKDKEINDKENAIRLKESELKEKQQKIDEQISKQVQEQLKIERTTISKEEARKAKIAFETELDKKSKNILDLQEILKSRDEKLTIAQKAEADFIKKQRELNDAKREMELTIEKRISEGVDQARSMARQEIEESLNLKIREKEQTISSMQKQIEDLKRKAEQGSQQLQGEAQELAIESLLQTKFPFDSIEPVPKGEFGGDVIQQVKNSTGQICG
ncbi:TPA: DUF2130 domain-containing protein, partial [Legionella pneumophila subsp. pneumophila]|nr:DUF2130 domain-containing protein [Legionella pneumophila subsp. pneumophila]